MRDFLKKISKKMIVAIGVFAIAVSSFIVTNNSYTAKADEFDYSDVLDDLRRDSTFSVAKYPADNSKNTLQLISISESVFKELFLYVYCPGVNTEEIRAKTLTCYFTLDQSDELCFYSLLFVNAQSTLFKYKVQDFTVSDAKQRYYNIKDIRVDNSKIYDVGRIWTFRTVNDNVTCAVNTGTTYDTGLLGLKKPETVDVDSGNNTSPNSAKNIKVVFAVLGILALVGGITYAVMYFVKGTKVKIKMPKIFKKLKFSFSKKKK